MLPVAASSPKRRLDAALADARCVAAVKADAEEGDRVTRTGRIGGRSGPVTPEPVLLVLVDPAVDPCARRPEDHGATSRDSRCEAQEVVTANAATVQLRSDTGDPIVLDATDFPPLATVTVTGLVAARPNPAVLVLHADATHVAVR